MYGLGVLSHLVPLAIQVSLLKMVWTRHEPLNRWTRISLLPITLGLIFSNWVNLKYQTQLPPIARFIAGCMLASLAMESVLFTFNQPSPSTSTKAKDTAGPTSPPTSVSSLTALISVVFDLSSDPTKQHLSSSGTNYNIHPDLVFLLRTIGRLLIQHFCAIITLICWKVVNDETPNGPLKPTIKKYKPEIAAACCGNIIWTSLDLFGCVFRLIFFIIKVIKRLTLKFLPSLSKDQPLFSKIDQTHLEETSPFLFPRPPLEATSISEFWGKKWHQKMRELVLEAGAMPFTSFLIWCFGPRKLHPKALQLAGVLAAFTISGLVHESGLWIAGPIDPKLKTTIFFSAQGVGVCLENVFKAISGRKVNGFLGKIWTFSWLIYFGTPMITIWLNSFSFDQTALFQRVNELGYSRMIWMPLIVPRLLSVAL